MCRNPSRRGTLSLLGTAALWAAAPPPATAATDTLGQAALGAGILFGTAVDHPIFDDPAYGALCAAESRILTTENAFKLAALRTGPQPADLHFGWADMFVDFAERHALKLRGTTLIWNDDIPGWAKSLSRREVARLFDSHIDAVVSRYAGRIYAYDVVNEPLFPWPGAGPGDYRRGIWFDALGPSYIARAFKRVAALDRKAKLVLNEAFTERDDAIGRMMRPRLLRLVDDLLDQGTPLQVVGLQGHVSPRYGFAARAYGELLHEIGRRGLDIHITELDVDDGTLPADISARDAAVAAYYRDFMAVALSEPAVKVVVTWGLSDRYSWYRLSDIVRTEPPGWAARPLPFDDRLALKPAYAALANAFRAKRA